MLRAEEEISPTSPPYLPHISGEEEQRRAVLRAEEEMRRRETQRHDDQLTVERNLGRLLDEKAR